MSSQIDLPEILCNFFCNVGTGEIKIITVAGGWGASHSYSHLQLITDWFRLYLAQFLDDLIYQRCLDYVGCGSSLLTSWFFDVSHTSASQTAKLGVQLINIITTGYNKPLRAESEKERCFNPCLVGKESLSDVT